MSRQTRIGIYGGSFNPVHFGHIGIAKRAIAELQLDRLIVVPANISPFKTEDGMAREMPWERLKLVKAAFAEVERAEVDEREIERSGVSYTIDTVREILAENPGAKLFLVIGEDNVRDFPKWKDADELARLTEVKAFPRTPESSTAIRQLFLDNKVALNSDAEMVERVRSGLVRKGGYCPCRLPKLPEFFCPCDEFKAQLRDPDYHGLCHCRLYLKP